MGGGFGRNTRHYRNASARYLIVDCSAANLTNVGELLTDGLAAGRCFLVPADLNALPFVDATFGATMVVQVHHHLPDIERALAEMGRPVGDRWLIDISITRHVSGVPRGRHGGEGYRAGVLAPLAPGTCIVNNMRRWYPSLPPLLAQALSPAAQLAEAAAQPGGRGWYGPSQFLLAQRPTPIPAPLAAVPGPLPAGVPTLATRMASQPLSAVDAIEIHGFRHWTNRAPPVAAPLGAELRGNPRRCTLEPWYR